MNVGTLAVRATVGPLFVGHGTQKLFGWFGGHGIDATAGFFESKLGLRPGKRHATLAGASEALGGVLLTLGTLTPLANAMITGTMVTAIRKVHGPNGPWVTESGWEYNAVLIAATTAATANRSGNFMALASAAAGAAGSYVVTELLNEPAPDPQPEPARAPSANGTPVAA
jgi:putative oxidoreductase